MLDICLGFEVYLFFRVSVRGWDIDLVGFRFSVLVKITVVFVGLLHSQQE